jgi:hypothetical protein
LGMGHELGVWSSHPVNSSQEARRM